MSKVNLKSISAKLILGGCLAVLIPLLTVGVIATMKSTDALLNIGQQNAKEHARNLAKTVETIFDLQAETVSAFAEGRDVIDVLLKVKEVGAENAASDLAKLRQAMKRKNGFHRLAFQQFHHRPSFRLAGRLRPAARDDGGASGVGGRLRGGLRVRGRDGCGQGQGGEDDGDGRVHAVESTASRPCLRAGPSRSSSSCTGRAGPRVPGR